MKHHWRRLLPTSCLVAATLSSSAAGLTENGRPAAVIIIAADATRSARFAALELQWHVEQISGAQLPITTQNIESAPTRILVGDSAAARNAGIHPSGFSDREYLVRITDDTIILAGHDAPDSGMVDYQDASTFPDRWEPCGSCHAVYDFLERLGVRWYLPTDLGVTFTPEPTLRAAPVDIRRAPHMQYRDPYARPQLPSDFAGDTVDTSPTAPLDKRQTELWYLRQRTGGHRLIINHSFSPFYRRHWPNRPELFAQGYDGRPPQLCYSHPDTVSLVVQDARDYFDGRKDSAEAFGNAPSKFYSDVFPVSPADNDSWCKCDACRAQLLPSAARGAGQFSNDRATAYWFQFVNKVAREIAKTHPDKKIGSLSYSQYCYPPENLESNVIISLCLHSRMVYAPDIVENDRIIMDAWKKAFPRTPKIVWIYYCFPALTAKQQQYRAFPGFFASHVKPMMNDFVDAGVYGLFIQPSYMAHNQQNLLMDQLEGWLTWKLADDPALDAAVLMAEFFERYYGPAAGPMRAFYELAEKTYSDPANYPPNTKHHTEEIAWNRLGTADCMQILASHMESARKLAVAEPFRQRVAVFDKGLWKKMQLGRQAYLERAERMAPTMQQAQAPRVTAATPGDPRTAPWDKAGRLNLQYGGLKGEPLERKLSARIAHDGAFLYLRYQEEQLDPAALVTAGTVWESDEWESFFARQRGEPYQQLGVTAEGKYETSLSGGTAVGTWEFNGVIHSAITNGIWNLLIAIPLDNLVEGGIQPGDMLYYNLIRSSRCRPLGCWIPTFAGYHAPSRFGEIYLEE